MKKLKKENGEGLSYISSVADLMAGMLLIFILLFIFITISSNREIKKKEDVIANFTKTREKIIDKVVLSFKENNIAIDIDTQTGSIKIDEKLLFANNDYKLKQEGKMYLKRFIPIYVKILILDKDIKDDISQIIIEGHTDDRGSYIFNMELSQKRAFEVLKYIYTEMGNFKGKQELKKYVTANGRSKVNLIYNKYGAVDRDKSRRVEIKFKLKEEETLEKIKDLLEN